MSITDLQLILLWLHQIGVQNPATWFREWLAGLFNNFQDFIFGYLPQYKEQHHITLRGLVEVLVRNFQREPVIEFECAHAIFQML